MERQPLGYNPDMAQPGDWKADIQEGGATFAVFAVGIGIMWLGWFLGYAWLGGLIGAFLILERQAKLAWRKTIRPAIIELIREALR